VVKAYIGLGSNLGDPVEYLRKGLAELKIQDGIKVTGVASVYKTEPIGYEAQDWFANTVVEVETELKPLELLRVLQDIEYRLGRVRTIRWGPRTLDLDILLYGEEEIHLPELEVPHPRITERAFVVVPLEELAPGMILRGDKISKWSKFLKKEQKITCTNEKL